jgi:hypothetical protein
MSKALTSYSSILNGATRLLYSGIFPACIFLIIYYVHTTTQTAGNNEYKRDCVACARHQRGSLSAANHPKRTVYIYIVYIVVCCLNSFFLRCLMGIASVIQPAIRTRPNKFLSLSLLFTHIDSVYIPSFSHMAGAILLSGTRLRGGT